MNLEKGQMRYTMLSLVWIGLRRVGIITSYLSWNGEADEVTKKAEMMRERRARKRKFGSIRRRRFGGSVTKGESIEWSVWLSLNL
jgi:hypothetical protein